MNDLERIKDLEKKLGIELRLKNNSVFDAQEHPSYFGNPCSYQIDDAGNITSLNLDRCSLYSLGDSYLEKFKHLEKLSIRDLQPK